MDDVREQQRIERISEKQTRNAGELMRSDDASSRDLKLFGMALAVEAALERCGRTQLRRSDRRRELLTALVVAHDLVQSLLEETIVSEQSTE